MNILILPSIKVFTVQSLFEGLSRTYDESVYEGEEKSKSSPISSAVRATNFRHQNRNVYASCQFLTKVRGQL